MGHYVLSPFQIDDRDEISIDEVSEEEDRPAVQLRDSIYTATGSCLLREINVIVLYFAGLMIGVALLAIILQIVLIIQFLHLGRNNFLVCVSNYLFKSLPTQQPILLHGICDRVRGNQAFGHAIHIRVRACIVGMVYFGEFWFFCLRGKQRHPRVQLATLERPNQHALAATALERQLRRSPLLVTRRKNRSEYGRVCGVEIGCRRLDRFRRGIRYQWVDFDVICPFLTVESVKNPPYAIVSQQKWTILQPRVAE